MRTFKYSDSPKQFTVFQSKDWAKVIRRTKCKGNYGPELLVGYYVYIYQAPTDYYIQDLYMVIFDENMKALTAGNIINNGAEDQTFFEPCEHKGDGDRMYMDYHIDRIRCRAKTCTHA